MKALFFPQYMSTPHIETDLELMAVNLEKRNDVYVVFCQGEMPTCLNNTDHKYEKCLVCKSVLKRGLKVVGIPEKNIIHLPKTSPPNNPIARQFKDARELKQFEINNVDIGAAAASTLFYTHDKEHKLDTIAFSYDVYRELKLGWYVYNSFKAIVKDLKPDLVYIFNGRYSGARMMMRVCEELKIEFYTHERAGVMNQYWLRHNTLPHNIKATSEEIFRLWNGARDDREKVARDWFVERRNGFDQGYHSFTRHQSVGLLPKNFDETKENIVIFNSTLEEIVAIPGWDNPIYEDDLEGIRKILDYFQDKPRYHFYFRVHPNLRGCHNSQVKEIEKLRNDFTNVTVISAESLIHTYSLLDHCTKVMVYSSTIGTEACFWGKPTILLARAMYEDLDCCYKPGSHEEVISAIMMDLKPKPVIEALKYGYWSARYGVPFKYFKQMSVITGLFKGTNITKMNLLMFFTYNLMRVMLSKDCHSMKASLKETLDLWILPKISIFKGLKLR